MYLLSTSKQYTTHQCWVSSDHYLSSIHCSWCMKNIFMSFNLLLKLIYGEIAFPVPKNSSRNGSLHVNCPSSTDFVACSCAAVKQCEKLTNKRRLWRLIRLPFSIPFGLLTFSQTNFKIKILRWLTVCLHIYLPFVSFIESFTITFARVIWYFKNMKWVCQCCWQHWNILKIWAVFLWQYHVWIGWENMYTANL